MSRATTEEWIRYYAAARQRRRVSGADPLERYRARKEREEKRLFIGSTLLLAVVLSVFYSVLVR
jgi:hypothetical protein